MKAKTTLAAFSKLVLLTLILCTGTKAQSQCVPQGDETTYGNNEWIGYVYANIGTDNAPANPFVQNYGGYVTQPVNFDQDLGDTSLIGDSLCDTYEYAINFAIRYKMKKTFIPGYYKIRTGGDDGFRLSIDGGNTYMINAWTDHGYVTAEEVRFLSGEVNFVYEYYEHQGLSRVTFEVAMAACASTAPDDITGNTVYSCNNATGITLTANGGIHGEGAQYQWGTGQIIGNNIIGGQTGASIVVAPSANTYYWVRRVNAYPCDGYTDGIAEQVVLDNGGAPGNPALFGDNAWHVYGYTGSDINMANNTYKGYYIQNTLGFETDAAWNRGLSPSTSPIWMGCSISNDNFTFIHKRQGFPCGKYTLRMEHWDDDTVLLVNGVQVWSFGGWSGGAGENERRVSTVPGVYTIFDFDASTTIEVRTREIGGAANARLIVTEVEPSVGPTALLGVDRICSGALAVLAAQGGALGADSEYQWGTGEVGSNVIIGATGSTLAVVVTENTTYWVRIKKSACDVYTPAATHYIVVPTPAVYKGSWSGERNIDTAIIIESNLTISEDTSACSCRVTNGATLTIAGETNFTVKGIVTVDQGANLIFENKASLLQLENVQNQGKATVIRESSKIKKLDYTIWSSPVQGQQLKDFSAQTLTNRFYEYNTVTNKYNVTDNLLDFTLAKGYLIRAPNNHPTDVPTVFTGTFKGVLHNGEVIREMTYRNDLTSYNATGNPYPSPMSISAFLSANPDIEGTLWFWRKTNDKTQPSYSTVTLIGYNANSAPGGENEYAVNPDGVVNIGQGFVVNARDKNFIVFRNSMRVGNSTSQFLRNGNNEPANLSRIWINVTGANDDFSQTLIGYLPQGTTGYDNGLDGRMLDTGSLNVYSIIPDKNLAIQGRPEFTVTDEVQLGFQSDVAGSFNFTIDHVDGLFVQGQDIFVKDNVTGAMHNLNNGSYTFQSEAGTFNDRFTVVYQNEPAMGTTDDILTDKNVVVYRSGKQIGIKATQNIKSVSVYDITGRMVYSSNNINAAEFTTTGLDTAQQVLIVKAQMSNNQVISKKFIMK